MSAKTTQKRSACDRCRSQKLRCLRSLTDGETTLQDEACSRCVRLAVECVTSSTKRPGRPRKAPQPQMGSSDGLGATASNNQVFSQPSPPQSIHVAYNDGGPYHTPAATTPSYSSTGWLTVDDVPDLTMLDDFSIPDDITNFLEQHSQPSIPHWTLLEQPTPPPTVPHLRSPKLAPNHSSGPPPAAADSSRACRLSELHLELCRQAFTLQSASWDISTSIRLSSDPSGVFNASTSPSSIDKPDPLACIIRTSTEFSSLLSSIQAAACSKHGFDAANPMYSSLPDSASTEPCTTLIILSCFIVIVTIYDDVLKEFRRLTQSQHQALSAGGPTNTNLYLGNVAIPASLSTSGRLLHCLVEEQLQAIEMLLGLPSEFCVSRKMSRNAGHRQLGLLGNQKALTLLMVTLQADTRHYSPHMGAMGNIESLRENLQAVLQID